MVTGVEAPFVGHLIGVEKGLEAEDVAELAVMVATVEPEVRPGGGGDEADEPIEDGAIILKDDGRMEADDAEQIIAREGEMDGPTAAAGEAAEGAMGSVWEGAIVGVDKGDEGVDKAVAKASAGRDVPVAVVGEDDDEGSGLAGVEEVIGEGGSADAYPLIVGVGLSVEEVEDGIALAGLLGVAGGQIDDKLLGRPGSSDRTAFDLTGLGEAGEGSGGWDARGGGGWQRRKSWRV
jgi:hypothetical protein